MNAIDIILVLVIGAVIARAVIVCIRNKKNGKQCGCGCGSCSGCKPEQKKNA